MSKSSSVGAPLDGALVSPELSPDAPGSVIDGLDMSVEVGSEASELVSTLVWEELLAGALVDEGTVEDVGVSLPAGLEEVAEGTGADEELGAAVEVSEVSIGTIVLGDELVAAGPPPVPSELAQELTPKVIPVTRAGRRTPSKNARD